jgi:ribosomal protein S18 acetylase RimI-like enzyme
MNSVEIRKVTVSDLRLLQAISRQTFSETFASVNSEADMQSYLENNLGLSTLQKELLDPNSEFFFAILDQKVIGYLKINEGSAQTEQGNEGGLEIERIYVLNKFFGSKVGQLLYMKALEIATDRKAKYIWLGVWEKNSRAISFYKKNGFFESGKHIFVLGSDQQTDIIMRRELSGSPLV